MLLLIPAFTALCTTLPNILDHRVRADINLAGVSFAEENNVVKLKFKNPDDAASIIDPTRKTGRGSFQTDALGPSFMIRLSDKHAFAVSTRFRTQSNVDDLDPSLVNLSLLKDVSSLNKLPITVPGVLCRHTPGMNLLLPTAGRLQFPILVYGRQAYRSNW